VKVGETWICKADRECLAKIEKIDGETVWCSSDFWRGTYPVDRQIFEKCMEKLVDAVDGVDKQ